MNIIDACHQNRLPCLSTMCDYGMDGRDGVNPLALFEMYRNLVTNEKITPEQLENAMKTDNLKSIIGIDVKSGYGKGLSFE